MRPHRPSRCVRSGLLVALVVGAIGAGVGPAGAGEATGPLVVGADAAAPPRDDATTRVVVELAPVADVADVTEAVDGTLVEGAPRRTVVIEVDDGAAEAAAATLDARPDVVRASPERYYRAAVSPNDPCFVAGPECRASGVQYDQWNLHRIGMPDAWGITQGDPSVRVAVIDTGVHGGHPDLQGKVVPGPDTTTGICPGGIPIGSFPRDHGSHVAGIIAAVTNNAEGIASVGWNLGVLSIKALDDYGCGATSWVANAIRAATDLREAYNVRVLNLSIESDQSDPFVAEAVRYAQSRGLVVVAAAGNTDRSTPSYPGAYPGVVSVGSTDRHDQRAPRSAYGAANVDLAAPGASIVSTVKYGSNYGYEVLSGTSMAAPHVAATIALVATVFPAAGPDELVDRVLRQADLVPGTLTEWAWGRLDTYNALRTGLDEGVWAVAADGGIFSFGNAPFLGSTGAMVLNQPIVGMASTPSGNGYWLVARDGGIFSFGDAAFFGSTGAMVLNQPIVGMAPTISGGGYWLVAADGGIFAFGDAVFHGSTGGFPINQPVVGISATPSGGGYHLVARDGGIFSFGDAAFFGSTGAMVLNQPIFAMASTPSGGGYWLVAADGGIFAFGDAAFFGSGGSFALDGPVRGLATTPTGRGYRMITTNGTVLDFGDAFHHGSLTGLNQPIVGLANRAGG